MSLIRDYYYRFQLLVHEIAKFGIVGAIGFVVQLGVQNGLHAGAGIGPTVSVVAAYCVATAVTFVGNRYWAFRHRKGKGLKQEAVTFALLNGVGIVIQVGLVDLTYYGLDMRDNVSYNIATVIGIGLATLFRLYSYRKFVFLAQPSSEEAESLQASPAGS
ncbi:MAG: GtrA family protein [Nocardiopsaceae bacterium]|nr:GtrA family protein [Nocardiopsaceae bacterium]